MQQPSVTAMKQSIVITYVPADCGSLLPGKSKAPDAFKAAGLAERLSQHYDEVVEQEALDRPAKYKLVAVGANGVKNEEANVEVCRKARDAVSSGLRLGDGVGAEGAGGAGRVGKIPFQLVIGGECVMVPAVMSAFWQREACGKVGLVYIDADADLVLAEGSRGNLASMTMAHAILREGCLESMKQFCRPGGRGVVDADNCVLFGTNMDAPGNTKDQLGYLFDEGFKVVTSAAVARAPEEKAKEALAWLEARTDTVLVHLDVDSIDPGEWPLANVPNWTGVRFEQMMHALNVFMASEKIGGLTIAEVNPGHDSDGQMVAMLVEAIVKALKPV